MGRETAGRNVAAEDRDTYANGAAFVDGQFVPIAEARVPILDWGFLRSDATYDVAHVWRGNFFRLEDHLDRFERSMEHLRLSLPYGRDDIRDILVECVRLSGLRDAYAEIICTRGMPRPGSRDPRECENRFYAFVVPFISIDGLFCETLWPVGWTTPNTPRITTSFLTAVTLNSRSL